MRRLDSAEGKVPVKRERVVKGETRFQAGEGSNGAAGPGYTIGGTSGGADVIHSRGCGDTGQAEAVVLTLGLAV